MYQHRNEDDMAVATVDPSRAGGDVSGAGGASPQNMISLLGVLDALVVKVLEKAGRRVLREDRSRYPAYGDGPRWEVHCSWPVSERVARRVTQGEWSSVKATFLVSLMGGAPGDVVHRVDEYVVVLLTHGVRHTPARLCQVVFGTPLDILLTDGGYAPVSEGSVSRGYQ